MKVWRVTLDDDTTVDVPDSQVLRADDVARDREGYGVYEAVSKRGDVLYTGRTQNLQQRLKVHRTQSPWWALATEIRWTPCDDYSEVVALERVGIASDRGAWNQNGWTDLPTARVPVPECMRLRIVALYARSDGDADAYRDLANYVTTARFVGWTLQAIASPLSITREAVRLISLRGSVDHDLFIPSPPRRYERVAKSWPRLRPAELAEMQALSERAQLVRGNTPLDHPNRRASERLTELMAEARMRGVRYSEIGDAAGVQAHTVRVRLARHGWLRNAPSQPSYEPGTGAGRPWAKCRRNHSLTDPDNVRLINGDPKRRICRACERIRSANYKVRKAAS